MKPNQPWGLGALLAISFGIFNLGHIIEQTVRWTNPFHGFLNGLIHVFVFGFVWLIYVLPWSLVIWFLYRWRKWRRFRSHWILAPSVALSLCVLASLAIDPPLTSKRFASLGQTSLPENRQHFRCHLSGGGLVDYSDTYYFETTPEEVDRLIREMKLSRDSFSDLDQKHITFIRVFPGWPDYSSWEGVVQYSNPNPRPGWFYYLITNADQTKVYIQIGCI